MSVDLLTAHDAAASVDGYWHPTGFMVWHTDIGRVHGWPAFCRHVVSQHPMYHNHTWTMREEFIHGYYTDVVYFIADEDRGPFAVYEVEYHEDRNDSTIRDTRRRVTLCDRPLIEKHTQGEVRFVDPEFVHIVTIPDGEIVVTHVEVGPSNGENPILLGEPGLPEVRRRRKKVTSSEFRRFWNSVRERICHA